MTSVASRRVCLWFLTLLWARLDAVNGFVPLKQKHMHLSSTSLFSSTNNQRTRLRRRDQIFKKLGIRPKGSGLAAKKGKESEQRYRIEKPEDLDAYFEDEERRFRKDNGEIDYSALLKALDVRGDTQIIGDPSRPDYTHPVAQILHARKRAAEKGEPRADGAKIALSVEGGGMRGCVSGGMVCAVNYLNLTDHLDVVYGSSAGTVVGAYMITQQTRWIGPEVYYDQLTTAGRAFIDTRRLLRALGYGLLDPRLLKDVVTRRENGGKPVLNLPFLLQTTLQETKPLDWDNFVAKQKCLPLKVVASDLKAEKAVVMDMENGYFESLSELAQCMHASCLLPGIAGPVMNMDTNALGKGGSANKYFVRNNVNEPGIHPLADALVYEPLPYHSAIEEGATHVVVLRSRPDGNDVTGKVSVFEKMISRRFFLRKNNLPNIFERMSKQLHKKLYARDVLELNEEAYSERKYNDTSQPHLLAVAAPPGSPEVNRLEVGRETIFEGMRRGFARAYDCLVEDPAERGRGVEVAKEFFPDEILEYDPLDINASDESAFAYYSRMKK